MSRTKVCVVTGSRAEYGILYWVIHDLRVEPDIELQLVVTGAHLSHEHGLTVQTIEADGFAVDRRVAMLLSDNSPSGVAKSVGLGVIGMSDALESLDPDVVLVLGDRFEIFAAAQACLFLRIPLAHIAGGDVTEGAYDESIRHSITKMAHIHFVTNEVAAQRVLQMGENPERVHVVGSPGLDHLRRTPLLDRSALEGALGASLGYRNLLVTFHPVTLQEDDGLGELDELLAALSATPSDVVIWVTMPNADTGGRAVASRLMDWARAEGPRIRCHTSLGQLRYLSLMAQVDAVVGNSSSGLYEAPSFGVPTVNVGERQRGRLAASSVIHCGSSRKSILAAIDRALVFGRREVVNPYGDGLSTARILRVLRALQGRDELVRKPFFRFAI